MAEGRRHYAIVYVETFTPESIRPEEIRSTLTGLLSRAELTTRDGTIIGLVEHAQVTEGPKLVRPQ